MKDLFQGSAFLCRLPLLLGSATPKLPTEPPQDDADPGLRGFSFSRTEVNGKQRHPAGSKEFMALDQQRIANAVHRVVCESTGSDGYGRCLHYAVAGSTILSGLTNRLWLPQVGTLQIQPDPERAEGVEWNAELGGLDAEEFHAWIAGPIGPKSSRPGRSRVEDELQLIDFTARHYRRMVERLILVRDVERVEAGAVITLDRESIRPSWKRPEQEYLWVRQLPPWIVLLPNERDTETALRCLGEFSGLIDTAQRACRELKGCAG